MPPSPVSLSRALATHFQPRMDRPCLSLRKAPSCQGRGVWGRDDVTTSLMFMMRYAVYVPGTQRRPSPSASPHPEACSKWRLSGPTHTLNRECAF